MWQNISKKHLAAGLAVLLGIAGGCLYYYYYYHYGLKDKDAENQEIVSVTRGKITSTVSATGTVKPVNAVDISSQITALIKEIRVKENDFVKTGQVLAILDDEALRTTLDKDLYAVNNTEAKYRRAKYLHSIGAKSDADLEDALLNYQTALATYKEDKSNLDKTVLVSPQDGVVLGEPVSVGTLVTAGVNNPTVIMMIGDVSQKMVKVKVDETDIGKIKPGLQATYTVDAYPDKTFIGTIINIGQISTSTTTTSSSSSSSSSTSSSSSSSSSSSTNSVIYYYVTLTTEDLENLLKSDMTARVNIKISDKDNALLIPLAALKTSTNGQYVTVLRDNGKRENVPVTLGLTSSDKVEIVSGLQEDDKLVISYVKSQSTTSTKQRDHGPPLM